SCWTIEALAARWRISQWWLWLPAFALELSWSYTWGPDYFFTLASLHGVLMVAFLLAALAMLGWTLVSAWRARGIIEQEKSAVEANVKSSKESFYSAD